MKVVHKVVWCKNNYIIIAIVQSDQELCGCLQPQVIQHRVACLFHTLLLTKVMAVVTTDVNQLMISYKQQT